jgi:4-hydroxyphenylacetate 3-monooxygenase
MGLRTGNQYLAALRDERQVYLEGQRVKDVTNEPRLGRAAHSVAALYDLQHDPRHADVLTTVQEGTGERIAVSYAQPRSVADVQKRGRALKTVADATYGMFGRTPDFMNVGVAALAAAAEVFDGSASGRELARNVKAFYDRACREDLAMTHVQVNPQVDRSKQVFEQVNDIALKVVKETDAGFYVNGMRLVGTLAQFADEIVVMPSVVVSNDGKAEDYAFAFVTPVAAPGVKIISRPSVVPQNAGHFLDHPLSAQYDEGDAVIVFENVFVPWERTFIYRDPAMCNAVYKKTFLSEHYSHQTMTRALAKAEFMAGLACYMAKAVKVDGFPNVQGQLAEMLIFVEMQRAFVERAESQSGATGYGTFAPSKWPLHAAQLNFFDRYATMINTVRTIGAGSLVGVPSYAELSGEIGPLVHEYFATSTLDSAERISLMRLAADASISAFSGRQALYERYYQGDPVRKAVLLYNEYPKDALTGRIKDLLSDLQVKAGKT